MIGERDVNGIPALALGSDDADGLEATFVPSADMVGCSLRHRGKELLGQRGGLRTYIAERSTMGIPLLHPWANRLARTRFTVAGEEVDLDDAMTVTHDTNGLPMHGLLNAAVGWRVDRHEEIDGEGLIAASYDFSGHPELMAAFPFPHEVLFQATLRGRTLTISTAVEATGDRSVPVSFGYHPYLCLPHVDRSTWEVEMPVTERLELDARMLPTGERSAVRVDSGPLGSRTFDDAYVAPAADQPFVLAGDGRRIEVAFGDGYRFAQVYAPPDDDVVAYEPMTAPTNALVEGGPDLPVLEPGERYEVERAGMASGTADLQRDLGGAIMQSILGALLTAGYAAAAAAAIAAAPNQDKLNDNVQNELTKSFSSAADTAERYPQQANQIIAAAKTSFLQGDQWAYLAGIIAIVIGAALVFFLFPKHAKERDLLAEYHTQDASRR